MAYLRTDCGNCKETYANLTDFRCEACGEDTILNDMHSKKCKNCGKTGVYEHQDELCIHCVEFELEEI